MTHPALFAARLAKSKNVEDVSYDELSQKLSVRYRGSKGVTYVYEASPELWRALLVAPSIGAFLHANVRNLPFAKIIDHNKARADG